MSGFIKPQVGSQLHREHRLAPGTIGNWAFNEGSGDMVYDLSGLDNHGTLMNMDDADWVSSEHGWALDLDGGNDYVSLPPGAFPTGGADLSVSGWFRTPELGVDQRFVWSGDAVDHNTFFLWMDAGGVAGWASLVVGGTALGTSTASAIVNTWQHVCVTHKSGATNGFKLYVDGVLIGQNNASASIDTVDTFSIGNFNNSQYAEGQVSSLIVYDQVLSANEIAQLYHDSFASIRARAQILAILSAAVGRVSLLNPVRLTGRLGR